MDDLAREFRRPEAGFYVLTNTRSMSWEQAEAVNRDIAQNLILAAQQTGNSLSLISRSDSTLRGHFPGETDVLAECLGGVDLVLLAPFFEAGGRYTLNDTHYVKEGEEWIPVAQTPFAQDHTFGFRSSNLHEWIHEKSQGQIPTPRIASLSIENIRQGPESVEAVLDTLPPRTICIVNAVSQWDIEIVALAALRLENRGKRIMVRSAASFAAARLGQPAHPLLTTSDFPPNKRVGGLIVVGSYVPKTTTQLTELHKIFAGEVIEIPVPDLLRLSSRDAWVADTASRISQALATGRDGLVFTSRTLITSKDMGWDNLTIGKEISETLVALVRSLNISPRWLIAKGGITSSDIATDGLGVRRAIVRGQLLPGVPVWELGDEAKFPRMPYIIFPGNVGSATALAEAYTALAPQKTT
jgi:uncharacterized protein YgbK (DUF1537 family)